MQSIAYNVGRSGTLALRTFLATPSGCFKIATWLSSAFNSSAVQQGLCFEIRHSLCAHRNHSA